jgi:lysozyme family protein
MDSNFDKCLAFVLKEEGGNDDDPNDHGGRTSRGIIQREWDKYLVSHPGLPSDVWKAPDADIRNIYHDSYWSPHCEVLPSGLDLVFFDFAVNAGSGQAIKKLQVSLGIPVDGQWGPQTEAAVKALTDVAGAINKFSDARETFYHGLAQYSRYGRDWSGRTERCRHASLLMVGVNLPSPKADPTATKPTIPPHGPASSAVVVAGGTVVAATYHSPLIFLGAIGAAVIIGLIVHYLVPRKVS